MTHSEAKRVIACLDNLEACSRSVEVGMTLIRHLLQDEFLVKTWNYDPCTPKPVPEVPHD